ncbi:hypothetical protein GGR55DRAFT_675845 [Xylaria sp. FL0064]|nr:hypothetical protein GGR55DRAFT_675845 [Xylaria sp. FL0064]
MQFYRLLYLAVFTAPCHSAVTPLSRDVNVNATSSANQLPHAITQPRSCGETSALVCFGADGGVSQNLALDDIQYAADYLKYLAEQAGDPLWTMPPEFDCSEWTVPVFGAGTVLVLAKHINPRTNSSVTYYDLARVRIDARTIDGGVDATPAQQAASLLGACGINGGEVATTIDAADPAYLAPEYIASGAKHQDIIVKLVRDPASV